MPSTNQDQDTLPGCLLRLFWFLIGNIAITVVAVRLLVHPSGRFSLLDVVYWSVVALILAARYADIRYFKGASAEGKPCTLDDWRRYAITVVLWAGTVWGGRTLSGNVVILVLA